MLIKDARVFTLEVRALMVVNGQLFGRLLQRSQKRVEVPLLGKDEVELLVKPLLVDLYPFNVAVQLGYLCMINTRGQ